MRRSVLLPALVIAAATVAVPRAEAFWSVGPTPTVRAHGCTAGSVTGDAAAGPDGVLRAFVRPEGGNCHDPRIAYSVNTGATWQSSLSPYRGRVLSVADDGASTYVLYSASDGTRLGWRRRNGTYGSAARLSTVVPLSGDLFAHAGKWWAVWSERLPSSGYAALFQARTVSPPLSRQRFTWLNRVDDRPSISRLASGTAVLAWQRYDPATRRHDIVRGSSSGGSWTVTAVTTDGVSRDPVVTATGPYMLLAWVRSGRIVYGDSTSGSFRTHVMGTAGRAPRLAASGGRVFVAWTSSASRSHVLLAERSAELWIEQDVTPVVSASQTALAVVGRTAQATVVNAEPARTYARSQVRPSVETFRYLGAWVDVFDYGLDPVASIDTMKDNGVRTLYFQTGRYNSSSDIANPTVAGQWLDAAHAAGLRAVAWYLPAYSEFLDRDVTRTVAAAQYVSPGGQRFDAVGIDIEFQGASSSPAEFNAGVVSHLRRVRAALGPSYPLGGIVVAPLAMELNPAAWSSFPWPAVGRFTDVVMPMGYWSFRNDCPARPDHCAYGYTRGNVSVARRETGLPVHVIGGVADDITTAEVTDFVQAARDGGVLGGSLYDFATTEPAFWPPLQPLS